MRRGREWDGTGRSGWCAVCVSARCACVWEMVASVGVTRAPRAAPPTAPCTPTHKCCSAGRVGAVCWWLPPSQVVVRSRQFRSSGVTALATAPRPAVTPAVAPLTHTLEAWKNGLRGAPRCVPPRLPPPPLHFVKVPTPLSHACTMLHAAFRDRLPLPQLLCASFVAPPCACVARCGGLVVSVGPLTLLPAPPPGSPPPPSPCSN